MLCSKDTFPRSGHLSSLQINWDNEKSCFDGFAREYSRFCCLRHDPFLVDSEKTEKVSSSSGSAGPNLADQVRGSGGGPEACNTDTHAVCPLVQLMCRQCWISEEQEH